MNPISIALRRRPHWTTALMACAVIVLALVRPAQSDDDPAFRLSELRVADALLDGLAEDLDGDGLQDILLTHRKGLPPDETRWVSIFWQSADGGFGTAADQSWELDPGAVIVDVGDVAGDPRKEICFATATAVRYHSLASDHFDTTPRTLFDASGITVFPSRQNVPFINFIRDWDDDGREEVGVFAFDGLHIYSANGEGRFDTDSEVSIDLITSMRRSDWEREYMETSGLRATFTVPDIHLADFDANGSKDLFATDEDHVRVFVRDGRGAYAGGPQGDFFFDVRSQTEKIEGIAEVETTVDDLNGDGYADVVVTKQTAKGLSSFRGVVSLYWGGPDGYANKPDQVIISEGTFSSQVRIRDVNGDGRKDVILPSFKASITALIRMLMTRSIKIYFNIFLLNEDNRLSERPDFAKEVKFKIDFSGDSDTQAADLDGDYNGDGRPDFVFATDTDELSLYLGIDDGGDRLFSKKPVAKVDADAYGELFSPDLNGDGYSDMLIYYPESKDRKGMVQVLMNLKRLE